jgi:protein-tyrosine phosphatase
MRIPVRDVDIPSPDTMRSILDAIDSAIDRCQPVYVHCWGGRGRTGTVVP